jgi:hypothetical protein
LGKPKSAAWAEAITDLQLMNGEMSQPRATAGSVRTLNLSNVSEKDAHQPSAPSKKSDQPKTLLLAFACKLLALVSGIFSTLCNTY